MKIFQAVHKIGSVSNATLAPTLGEDPYVTAYHTQALVKAGVLQSEPSGRRIHLTLDPRYHKAAETLRLNPALPATPSWQQPTMQTG